MTPIRAHTSFTHLAALSLWHYPGELGVSKSMECDSFPFSALIPLVERQEGHPASKINWMLVCWW